MLVINNEISEQAGMKKTCKNCGRSDLLRSGLTCYNTRNNSNWMHYDEEAKILVVTVVPWSTCSDWYYKKRNFAMIKWIINRIKSKFNLWEVE